MAESQFGVARRTSWGRGGLRGEGGTGCADVELSALKRWDLGAIPEVGEGGSMVGRREQVVRNVLPDLESAGAGQGGGGTQAISENLTGLDVEGGDSGEVAPAGGNKRGPIGRGDREWAGNNTLHLLVRDGIPDLTGSVLGPGAEGGGRGCGR